MTNGEVFVTILLIVGIIFCLIWGLHWAANKYFPDYVCPEQADFNGLGEPILDEEEPTIESLQERIKTLEMRVCTLEQRK